MLFLLKFLTTEKKRKKKKILKNLTLKDDSSILEKKNILYTKLSDAKAFTIITLM